MVNRHGAKYALTIGPRISIGMHHALEPDHVAAVSSMAARQSKVKGVVKHGLTWGLGHTITLFMFAGAAIILGRSAPRLGREMA